MKMDGSVINEQKKAGPDFSGSAGDGYGLLLFDDPSEQVDDVLLNGCSFPGCDGLDFPPQLFGHGLDHHWFYFVFFHVSLP